MTMMINKTKTFGVEKFDVVVMNPPYNIPKKENSKVTGNTLWNIFVIKVIEIILKTDGYLTAVHPGGWRNYGGRFKKVQDLLINREMHTLKIHNFQQGRKLFGVQTDFDFYCLRNRLNTSTNTVITDINKTIVRINIKKYSFIPKSNIVDVYSLLAKRDEETVNILHSYSAYESRKSYVSKIKNDEFKYPCIQNISIKNHISCLYYSNTDKNGHFGVAKLIFGRKHSGVFLDEKGEYGMAEDCCAIVDSLDNLKRIKKVIESKVFIENIMGYKDTLGDKYNRKIISLFRKDFWVDFLNYDNDDQ